MQWNPYALFFQNHLLQLYYLFPGYLEDLLNYIHNNLTIERIENAEENYAQNIFEKIKENLTSVMQEEIQKSSFKTPSDKTVALEELRRFRREFSLKENDILDNSIWASWLKNSEDSELISKFISELDFSNQNVTGKMKFTATKISTTGQLDVTLNSVNHLLARREDDKINFSVTVALLPIPSEKKYRKKFQTKVYNDHDTKEPYLFDLSLNRENLDNYKTKFMLMQSGKDQLGEYKVGEKQFLQFTLYDHSRTKTNKIFMGTFFIPIDKIDEKKEKNQASEEKFYKIDKSLNMNKDIFDELEKRKSKFVDNIDKCIKKGRKVSLLENLKKKSL